MAVKCGYEMSTYQEVASTLAYIISGILGSKTSSEGMAGAGFLGGIMNQKIGTSEGTKCPRCGVIGRWEDK